MRKVGLGLLLLTSCFASYASSIQSLNKSQVMRALEDKTITTIPLVTLRGNLVPNNTASIYFGKGGKLGGHFEAKPDNEPQNDEGTWQVKANGEVCVNWKVWTDNKPTCVYAYKLANSLIFVNANNKFESMVLSDNIVSGNQVAS